MKNLLIVSMCAFAVLGTSTAAFARHHHRWNNTGYGSTNTSMLNGYNNNGLLGGNGYGYGNTMNNNTNQWRHHHRRHHRLGF